MKKKGFTLIELLAVIVILAIIALIATPTILGVIEKARKGATEQSALGYIDAIEKQIMINDTNNIQELKDGTYLVEDINISYKGKGPTKGTVTIKKGEVITTNLCFNTYSVDYDGTKATISKNNYCKEDKVILKEKENINEIAIENKKAVIDLTNYTDYTNIHCNNNAKLEIENNQLIVTNIIGEVTCQLDKTLEDTFSNLDDSSNSVMMLSDETLSKEIAIEKNKNVTLDLNGKTLTYNGDKNLFKVNGNLTLNGNNGIVNGTGDSIYAENSNLLINGGEYNKIYLKKSKSTIRNTKHHCTNDILDCYPIVLAGGESLFDHILSSSKGKAFGIISNSKTNTTIKNSEFYCYNDNCVYIYGTGITKIENTKIQSVGYALRNNSSGTVTIYNSQFEKLDVATKTNRLVINDKNGIINIYSGNYKGKSPDKGAGNETICNSSSGIINIYGGYFYSEYSSTILISGTNTDGIINIYDGIFESRDNHNIWNNYGIINIKGGKYISNRNNIVMGFNGKININGGTFKTLSPGQDSSIDNRGEGIINICAATIDNQTTLPELYNRSIGYIYYNPYNVAVLNVLDDNSPTHIISSDSIKCN